MDGSRIETVRNVLRFAQTQIETVPDLLDDADLAAVEVVPAEHCLRPLLRRQRFRRDVQLLHHLQCVSQGHVRGVPRDDLQCLCLVHLVPFVVPMGRTLVALRGAVNSYPKPILWGL